MTAPTKPLIHDGGDEGGADGMAERGPIIQVTLGPDPEDIPVMRGAGIDVQSQPIRLMIDTGAYATVIEEKILQGLGLSPVYAKDIVGVSQKPETRPVYRVGIGIWVDEQVSATARYMALFTADVVGIASPAWPTEHVGLLGRDFLAMVQLVYDGPSGRFRIIDSRHLAETHLDDAEDLASSSPQHHLSATGKKHQDKKRSRAAAKAARKKNRPHKK